VAGSVVWPARWCGRLGGALRYTVIIIYYKVLKRREDLVSLATRLESIGRRSKVYTILGSTKRYVGEAY
jgi:hypothetical protein